MRTRTVNPDSGQLPPEALLEVEVVAAAVATGP
jgi:hypothetical protein